MVQQKLSCSFVSIGHAVADDYDLFRRNEEIVVFAPRCNSRKAPTHAQRTSGGRSSCEGSEESVRGLLLSSSRPCTKGSQTSFGYPRYVKSRRANRHGLRPYTFETWEKPIFPSKSMPSQLVLPCSFNTFVLDGGVIPTPSENPYPSPISHAPSVLSARSHARS